MGWMQFGFPSSCEASGATLEALFLIAAFCRLAKFLSLVSADRFLLKAVGWRHLRPNESGRHSCR
jgi:hypothetical protein